MLLAVSGSLSIEILPVIIEQIRKWSDVDIRVLLDKASAERIPIQSLLQSPRVSAIYTDADWQGANAFLQYELRSWLDFMPVAPCDHKTISTILHGIGDDLLSTILRIFDTNGRLNPPGRVGRYKYLSIAPAMDSPTWQHPLTKEQLHKLRNVWCYSRPFEKGEIPFVTVLKPLKYDILDFDCFEDDCNINMARILAEVGWQLDKFRKHHDWYVPGV